MSPYPKLITATVVGLVLLGAQSRRQSQLDALKEPFVGVTTSAGLAGDLYGVRSTGISTEPVRTAAEAFIGSLSKAQREATLFDVDSTEWRDWHNVHRAPREGISFGEMSEHQRELAFELFGAGLSAKGLAKTKNVMRLNEHLGDLVGKLDEYGEEYYFVTILGEPSSTEPWGWQLDGHHLVFNYFVLGDQVVLSPSFMGSEPVVGSGDYEGVTVMQPEQDKGHAFMSSLDAAQQSEAMLPTPKGRSNTLAAAFNDNLVLDYAGVSASRLNAMQKALLVEVIEEYVHNLGDPHARIRMDEVKAHLDETYFAWIGDSGPDGAFYYRIHSPVLLIEFDHQGPIALGGPKVASRRHVHSVVRTPNGNDYGKDLLRRHYEAQRESSAHGHVN